MVERNLRYDSRLKMRVRPSKYLKELNLLYVEDDAKVKEAFLTLVERYFQKVFVASNGEEGWELFVQNPIDIVISDIRMPKMDGLAMTQKIKKRSPQTPVLLLTAFNDNEYLMKALELGVEGYIVKPIDRNKLFEKLNLFAQMLHFQKEQQNIAKLLQLLFDRFDDAIALFEEDALKLANKKFYEYFGDIASLEEFEEFLGSKLEDRTIVQLQEPLRYFEVSRQNIGEFAIFILQDITFLRHELFEDELTGAYNRKYFDVLLEKLIGQRVCMLFFDIDDFKKINDTYGHDVGDMVLKKLAQVVRENIRQNDELIRWGGEEFLVVLDGIQNKAIAERIGKMLVEKVAATQFEQVGKVTISLGAGCRSIATKEDFQKLYKLLDDALYRAKRAGKNRVEMIKDPEGPAATDEIRIV